MKFLLAKLKFRWAPGWGASLFILTATACAHNRVASSSAPVDSGEANASTATETTVPWESSAATAATTKSSLDSSQNSNTNDTTPLTTLEELKREEFSRPRDARIKAELARNAWCRRKKGLAVEHWMWLEQFVPESDQAVAAKSYLQKVRDKDEAGLTREMACSK